MSQADVNQTWRRSRLGDVATVLSGATPKTSVADYWNGDIVWLTPKDLGALEQIEVSTSERRITHRGFESCSAQVIPTNSVVMSSRAPIGHLAINTVPVCTNQGCKSFVPKTELNTRYLYWALRSAMPEIQHRGDGGTFDEVSKADLEAFEIPIPPFAEQQRLVARIEGLTSRLERARLARQVALDEAEHMLAAAITSILEKRAPTTILFRELLSEQPRNGWSPPAEYQTGGGTPVLTLSSVTGFHYDGSKVKLSSAPTKEGARYWLEPGDLLITRSNTPELVGHAAIYDGTPAKAICCDLIMKMKVNSAKADVRFLHYCLRSSAVRQFISKRAKGAKGASGTMQKIAKGDVQEIPIADLPVAEQRRIVARLDALAAKQAELRRLQTETETELAAFTPALLAKAFRGEL